MKLPLSVFSSNRTWEARVYGKILDVPCPVSYVFDLRTRVGGFVSSHYTVVALTRHTARTKLRQGNYSSIRRIGCPHTVEPFPTQE